MRCIERKVARFNFRQTYSVLRASQAFRKEEILGGISRKILNNDIALAEFKGCFNRISKPADESFFIRFLLYNAKKTI